MRRHELLIAAGVLVHARAEGLLYNEVGRIVVNPASDHGVDEHLWHCLRIAADQLGLAIRLHAPERHRGRAVTIDMVGQEGGGWRPVALANPDAIRLAEYLRVHGFHAGEDGDGPALRLGPPQTALNPTPGDHSQHLWVSLPRSPHTALGSGNGAVPEEPVSTHPARPAVPAGLFPAGECDAGYSPHAGVVVAGAPGIAVLARARGPPAAAIRERLKQ